MSDHLDPDTRHRVAAAGGQARTEKVPAEERSRISAKGAARIHSAPGLAKRLVAKMRDRRTTDAERAEARQILEELEPHEGGA